MNGWAIFNRPYGTISFLTQIPSYEWLGYFQSSRWDFLNSPTVGKRLAH